MELPASDAAPSADRSGARANVVVSRRHFAHVGWVPIDEFEDLFVSIGGGRVVAPPTRRALPGWLGRARNRLVGDVAMPAIEERGDILLVVARSPRDLQAVRGLATLRKQFRYVVGYVIDSYFYTGYSSATRLYDHVFTTTAEGAEFVRRTFGVPSSVLYQGFDCLAWATESTDRPIDLLGLGRQPPSYHRAFQQAFHRVDSPALYLHSPIGALRGPEIWTERPMVLKVMQRSKLGLAFHLMVEPTGVRATAMFITSRWYELLATGCVVVGKRPHTSSASDLIGWEGATIELPDDPALAVGTLRELLQDGRHLREQGQRNALEMCRRNDWRYRILEIYRHFELQPPAALTVELAQLRQRIEALEAHASGQSGSPVPALTA